jgi:hypothetical protein
MATPPAGWVQRSTNPQEYEAILDLGNFEKYEVNVNVQTGQRQIYAIDANPILPVRTFIGTINADGTTVRQEGWNKIADLPNGQTRLKNIIDASRTASNKIVGSVGTEEQKRRLAEQKEYSKLKSGLPATGPGSVPGSNPDQTGPNSGAASGITSSLLTPTQALGTFRDVSNFQDEKDNYGSWKYPESMNSNQDYMTISVFKYQVADVFSGSNGTSTIDSGLIFGGANISSRSQQTKSLLGTVTLPMPSNVSEANQTGWGEDSLSGLTAGMMGAASQFVTTAASGDLFGAAPVTVDAAKDVLSSKGAAKSTIQQLLTLNAAAAGIKKLGLNVNAESYRARVTGTVINPNLELLFNGPKLRSFQFTYKLAPRSATEAKQIRGMIKLFKKAMAPRRSSSAQDAFFLGAPDVFKVVFKHKGKDHPGLPTLKTCALVNFSVNYTADGFYSAYIDGQPVSVEMSMSFAELTPIYNDNYDNPNGNTVGFVGGSDGVDQLENPRFDPQDPSEQQNNANRDQAPPPPAAGGASPVVAPATGVFQQGGPTATPGVDTPGQFSGRPGSEPTFTGGGRGI